MKLEFVQFTPTPDQYADPLGPSSPLNIGYEHGFLRTMLERQRSAVWPAELTSQKVSEMHEVSGALSDRDDYQKGYGLGAKVANSRINRPVKIYSGRRANI